MKNHFLQLLCCLFTLGGYAQNCLYLAYDGCNYSNTMALDGLSGGTGWGGPWEVQNDNIQVPGYQGVTGTLGYLDLQSFGNRIGGGSAYTSSGRRFDLSASGPFNAYLDASTGMIGAAGTTLYWSVLLRKNANNDQTVFAMLQGGNNVPWVISQNPRAAVGYFGTQSNDGSGTQFWSIRLNDQVFRSSVPIVAGTTAMFIMRIDFGTNSHTISTWINPSSVGSTVPSASLFNSINGTFRFHSFSIYLGDLPNQGAIDEIRVGASYECAAPGASTDINVPPDAIIVPNRVDGVAPLVVYLDGTSSVDPDGSIRSYSWNFNDDSPVLPGPSGVSHTFFEPGEYDVSLTVTDNDGQQHTTYRRITVRSSANSFPCRTSLRLLNKVTCGSADGRLQVIARYGAALSLRDSIGQIIPLSDPYANIYANLYVGNYRLYVQHPGGCRDTFSITIQTDSNTCAGWRPPQCLKMGINLDYLNFYGSERPFKNIFRYASDWITYNVTSATPWIPWDTDVADEIPTDENGYPQEVPFRTSIGDQGVRSSVSANGAVVPGNYTLWYDGEGVVELNGVPVNNITAGRIDFTVPENYTGNIWINIARSQRGNNIRNIRILRPGDETTYREQPFYTPFLDKLAPFYAIRYGEWGNLNTGTFVPLYWEDRASPAYFTEASIRGVSYETMIDLCNATNKDIWIGVPHTATDEYIREMATLFLNRLKPELNVYLEYSNEVWNWFFAQAHYVRDNSSQNLSHARKYAQKARNTFRIWHSVWGGQSNRVKRLLNTQISNYPFGEEMMAELNGEFDYLSPSWYFGYTGSECQRNFNGSTTAQEVIDCTRDFFRRGYAGMKQDYLNASLFNKQVINYEGGQHMTDGTITPYINAVWDAQVHPDIYNLYNEVLDSLKKLGPVLTNPYNLARFRRTPYGSFGHLEHIDERPAMDNAPKWMAIMNNACPFGTPVVPPPVDPDDPDDPNNPDEPGDERRIRIYPNPFNSTLHLDSACNNCNYRIVDSKGREVYKGPALSQINLSGLSSGIYVLFIYDNRGRKLSTHKLMKM